MPHFFTFFLQKSAVARAISRPASYLTPMTGGSHQTEGVKGRGLQGQDVAVFGDPDQGFDASFTIYETCAFVRSCDIGNTPYGGLEKGQNLNDDFSVKLV